MQHSELTWKVGGKSFNLDFSYHADVVPTIHFIQNIISSVHLFMQKNPHCFGILLALDLWWKCWWKMCSFNEQPHIKASMILIILMTAGIRLQELESYYFNEKNLIGLK